MFGTGPSVHPGTRFATFVGAAVALAVLLLSTTSVQAQQQRMRAGPGVANPSAVVAADLGFARLAQEKGQWTAFRETAEKDAVLFMPHAVNAPDWLRKQVNPAEAMRWQPHRVFIACDGSYALTTGPWQKADGTHGSFATIWRQQRNGSYKWLLNFGSDRAAPANADGEIEARVADCPRRNPMGDPRRDKPKYEVVRIANPPPTSGTGQSADGSLRWAWSEAAGARSIEVTMRNQGADASIWRENDEALKR